MWHKLDKLNLDFMQVYNETLLTAIDNVVSDFRCTNYATKLICDHCPFNVKDVTCTVNPKCDGSEVDKEHLVTSATKLTFEEWQKWFYNVTGIADTRSRENVSAKVPLFYYDKERVHGDKETNDLPEFNFDCSTSDKYPEIDLVEYRKLRNETMNNMKESEETMKEEAKSTDYIRATDSTDQDKQDNSVDDVRINNDAVHDFRQYIKYNVELILGEDREKYEYVTLKKMLEIVDNFMTTYKSWMMKFTFNDLDDLDHRNSRLGCRVLNASTGQELINIYTSESNFGLKRKFVFKD